MNHTIPPDQKKSSRRRRLLYLAAGFVLSAGVLLLYLQISASRSEAAYRAKIQNLRDAGEPFSVAEVCDYGAVPDENNAVIPLRQAASLVPDLDTDTWEKVDDLPFVIPLSDAERDFARLAAGPVDQIEVLIRDAMSRPSAHWKLTIEGNMIDAPFPDLNAQRALAQAIGFSILLSADRGEFVTALDQIPLLFAIERALQMHPAVVGYLVSTGVESLALARIEDVAARMRIGRAPGEVPAVTVRSLIKLLADDPGADAAIRHAIRGDRAQLLQVCQPFAEGRLPDGTETDLQTQCRLFLQRAQLWDGCATAIDTFAEVTTALEATNWPACMTLLPQQGRYGKSSNPVLKMVGLTTPALIRVARWPYSIRTQRRLARTGLALHLYASDHAGAWPESLNALVPDYLNALPIDAMSSDDSHVRWAAPTAVVYSVGPDGVDDGGNAYVKKRTSPKSEVVSLSAREYGDTLFQLKPQPRPAPETSEDDADFDLE